LSLRRWLAVGLAPVAGLASFALVVTPPATAGATPSVGLLPEYGPARPVTFSGLAYPHGVAAGALGDLFVADTGRDAVVTWPKGGIQRWLPFTGLNDPESVAVDRAGTVYVTDTNNNRIVALTTDGRQTTLAFSGLNQPESVAVDDRGRVLVADTNNNQILAMEGGRRPVKLAMKGLNGPYGVAVDTGGAVYVADTGNNRVVKLAPGRSQVVLPFTDLHQPQGVAVDRSGTVFVVDTAGRRVIALPQGGAATTLGFGDLNHPSAIAVNASGSLFVADGMNNQVVQLPVGPPPLVVTTSIPTATPGAMYPVTALIASGGTSPYTWSVASGMWPSGLALSPSGVISGTPRNPGMAVFTVLVTDAEAPPAVATATLTMQVSVPAAPAIPAAPTAPAAPAASSVPRPHPAVPGVSTGAGSSRGSGGRTIAKPPPPTVSNIGLSLPAKTGFNPVAVAVAAKDIVQAARQMTHPQVSNPAHSIVAAAQSGAVPP
jgi:sugar lactone lactonase YvrE